MPNPSVPGAIIAITGTEALEILYLSGTKAERVLVTDAVVHYYENGDISVSRGKGDGSGHMMTWLYRSRYIIRTCEKRLEKNILGLE